MKSFLAMMIVVLACRAIHAKEEARQCRMKRDYWLYTPDTLDPQKTYWLVVGVHGHRGNGKGAAGLAGWVAEFDNVIVVGPTFPSNGPYYQVLGGDSDRQLLDVFAALGKEFKLHDRMFLYGFSGGSQYVHRFACKHPRSVIGASSHSGGTWEKKPDASASSVLWTVSCGLKDTAVSAGADAPRIECFRRFYEGMNGMRNFTCKPFVGPWGHGASKEVREVTKECFRVATTGLFDYQRDAVKDMTAKDREAWIRKDSALEERVFDDGKNTYTLKVNKDGWTVTSGMVSELAKTRKMLDGLAARKKS